MSPSQVHSRRRNFGLSLPEVMVAIVISMLLMGGIIQIFASNRATYELTDDLARLQENGRFALDFLLHDIRMAGYFGCNDNPEARQLRISTTAAGQLWDTGSANNPASITYRSIEGADDDLSGDWNPSGAALPAGVSSPTVTSAVSNCPNQFGQICTGTDAIAVRYAEGGGARAIDNNPTTTSASLTLTATDSDYLGAGLITGQFASISDCSTTDIVPVFNTPTAAGGQSFTIGTGGSPSAMGTTSKIYTATNRAEVAPLMLARYYIGTGAAPWAGPSLFRETSASTTPVEMVQGIENMQIAYGVDSSGDGVADSYLQADAVGLTTDTHWSTVVSLRVGLLVRTLDEINRDADDRTYDLFTGTRACTVGTGNPECVQPVTGLRVQRRVFTTTTSMRNLK